MKNDYIAFIDSGVGGLSLLKIFKKALPNENFLYFGDNDNAPYGNKSKRELWGLTLENLAYIKTFGIKYLVVSCNTLSITLIDKIRDFMEIDTFGVYPPVAMDGGNKLLLATPLTANTYKEQYPLDKSVTVLGLPRLAKDIECGVDKVNINEHVTLGNTSYDTVFLGCTHYYFVKNKIFNHLKPQKIISGNDYTLKFFTSFYKKQKSLVNKRGNRILFVGKNAKINQDFWEKVVNQKYKN